MEMLCLKYSNIVKDNLSVWCDVAKAVSKYLIIFVIINVILDSSCTCQCPTLIYTVETYLFCSAWKQDLFYSTAYVNRLYFWFLILFINIWIILTGHFIKEKLHSTEHFKSRTGSVIVCMNGRDKRHSKRVCEWIVLNDEW